MGLYNPSFYSASPGCQPDGIIEIVIVYFFFFLLTFLQLGDCPCNACLVSHLDFVSSCFFCILLILCPDNLSAVPC